MRQNVRRAVESEARDRSWRLFIDNERRELLDRGNGQLARLLMVVSPEESREELERLVGEDQRYAVEGLLQLRRGDETYYKHIDELTIEDMPARVEAESARLQWLTDRTLRVVEATRQRHR